MTDPMEHTVDHSGACEWCEEAAILPKPSPEAVRGMVKLVEQSGLTVTSSVMEGSAVILYSFLTGSDDVVYSIASLSRRYFRLPKGFGLPETVSWEEAEGLIPPR